MSKKSLTVIILAAGKGSRMKSDIPKVLHKIAGLAMVNWLIKAAEALEPENIITVIAPDMVDVKKAVAPHNTVVQKVANGTGGAVKAALPLLKDIEGDVLILLGDAPLIGSETMRNLIAARHNSADTGLSVLGVYRDNPDGYGRIVERSGILDRIVEHKDASADEKRIKLVNTGAFCVDGARINEWLAHLKDNNVQKELYITDLPAIAAIDGIKTRVLAIHDTQEVQGCNTRGDLAALEKTAQNYLRSKALEAGVHMIDPDTVYFSHDTKIAPDVTIEPNVYFGAGVKVKKGAHIKAFSHIEGTVIGEHTTIGPFARLRPGTKIGREVRIGNFVEVKKSNIGDFSKINHLAYVGDTDMGQDVNFSAGAITVNYDGFQKHKTTIGRGVMVGSNANLVAPLTIDDGAFIAAGSTITEDVPADALSISRDVSRIREGWAAEYRRRKKAAAAKKREKG